MGKKVAAFLEGVVVIVILLVLVQTFLEDYAVLAGWQWKLREKLILTGFCFDLFFTIEFLIRLYFAIHKGSVKKYIFKKMGWIDFFASIPLLMLNSGPAVIALFAGGGLLFGMGGILNILKVVKAIRIARILRLLRILKIFKQIKNTESPMAQRHIAKVSAISISVFVFTLLAAAVISIPLRLPFLDSAFMEQNEYSADGFVKIYSESNINKASLLFSELNHDLLIVKQNDNTVYSRYDNEYYNNNFGHGDYQYIKRGNLAFFYDIRPLLRLQAKDNIIYFTVVVIMVLFFMLFYSLHFAITVSDPIHVMRRGFEEKNYNLEVKIPEEFCNDDIFRLAADYNKYYLPMKARNAGKEDAESLELKMDDIKDLFKNGI